MAGFKKSWQGQWMRIQAQQKDGKGSVWVCSGLKNVMVVVDEWSGLKRKTVKAVDDHSSSRKDDRSSG